MLRHLGVLPSTGEYSVCSVRQQITARSSSLREANVHRWVPQIEAKLTPWSKASLEELLFCQLEKELTLRNQNATCLAEYRNDGTAVPKELRKGVSAVTGPYGIGHEVGCKLTSPR
jgi:hypothetical protein